MATPPPTLGLLLAGGQGRRMGGVDKAFLSLAGRPLLAHVVDRAAPQCAALLLNAAGDPKRFEAFGLPQVADPIPGFAGPLAGVLAGLTWLEAHRPDLDWLVSFPTDTPFVPSDLVARLHQARAAAGTPLAWAESSGRPHPVCALWPKALRPALAHAVLQNQVREVTAWAMNQGVARATYPTTPHDPFLNLNRPDDIAKAERIAATLAP
ncbi:MAG: molybdenum cofactor guanylyltransferase MobA [Geminicoccaceae bacterium]|nr:MAG: molybdenum cofactor guanylyltransferase MobA [Geminicoccaceae bacterium]